jgi:hypothetical protein
MPSLAAPERLVSLSLWPLRASDGLEVSVEK